MILFRSNHNHVAFIAYFSFVLINKCTAKQKKIELRSVTPMDINDLKQVNDLIYPFQYPNLYYDEIINNADDMARLAYYEDQLAGAVACRETYDNGARLYIITLGCLKEYRRFGVGSAMLRYVLDLQRKKRPKGYRYYRSVYLHVQTNNTLAVTFYRKYGFRITQRIEDYYPETLISPTSAFLLEKDFNF